MHAPNKQAGRAMSAAQNKMHINDWAAIQTLFDKLNKQLERTQKASRAALAAVGRLAARVCPLRRRWINAALTRAPATSCAAGHPEPWRPARLCPHAVRAGGLSEQDAGRCGPLGLGRCLPPAWPTLPYDKCAVPSPSRLTAEKPKLSPTNTRALTRMKQTLRKHNAAYTEQMRLFR